MKSPVFADAAYWIALANPRDELHVAARRWGTTHREPVVTTQWVVAEAVNFLSSVQHRPLAARLLDWLQTAPLVTVLPAGADSFDAGSQLFRARPDKEWSLVDCISFEVMRERGLNEALTADHHFEQAGFRAMLKP